MTRRSLLQALLAGLAAALVPASILPRVLPRAVALAPAALPAAPALVGSSMSFTYRASPWDGFQHFAVTWDGARYAAFRNAEPCAIAEVPGLPFALPEPFAHLSRGDRVVGVVEMEPMEYAGSFVGTVAAWSRPLPPEVIARQARAMRGEGNPDMEEWREA